MRAYLRFAVMLLALWGGVKPAQGHSAREFDIPAQALARALDHFSQQSGMAVLVDRGLTRRLRSMPLQGRFTPREGLQRLLEGTGLIAHYSGADGFTLRAPQVSAAQAPARRPTLSASSFAKALQQALEQALCASAQTRPGHYRAALQVWIDSNGVLVQSRLLASTGDVQRDEALIERLRALRLQRPPPSSLAQPVTLLLHPQPMECHFSQGAAAA